MIDLLDINKNVIFDEPNHTYKLNNKQLISVTTVLGFYKNKFDPNGHIARACSKRDGISVEEVKKNWFKTKTEGQERGKNFHSQAEHFIKTGEVLEEDYKDVILQLKDFPFKGKLFSEIGLHDEEFGIAGTCDLISLSNKRNVISYDFKTNKAFTIKSKYNQKLLYPLQHLAECDLVTYSLQLGIYNLMLEGFGYKIKKGSTILYINPETRQIDKYPILDLDKEVKILLNHFKEMRAW